MTIQRNRLLTVSNIENLPDLDWLIKGVLPVPAFVVLYGEPGSGKSFVALDMALACASGRDWLGRMVKEVQVLYVAAEGVLGFKNRLRAHGHRRGFKRENIRFYPAPFQITDPTAIDAFLAALKAEGFRPGLIIVDTLARMSVGSDENNAKDMGQVVAGFDRIKAETGATVMIIHHTRKGGDSERGSSALRGAADVMIKCEKLADMGGATLTCNKMKDDEPFKDISIGLEKVQLPGGASSLVVGDIIDALNRTGQDADKIIEILEAQFADTGATHGELRKAFVKSTGKSLSTFDRAWRQLKPTSRIRVEGVKGDARHFSTGVSVKLVSEQCQTPTQLDVMSPPSLGGDIDTSNKVVRHHTAETRQAAHQPGLKTIQEREHSAHKLAQAPRGLS